MFAIDIVASAVGLAIATPIMIVGDYAIKISGSNQWAFLGGVAIFFIIGPNSPYIAIGIATSLVTRIKGFGNYAFAFTAACIVGILTIIPLALFFAPYWGPRFNLKGLIASPIGMSIVMGGICLFIMLFILKTAMDSSGRNEDKTTTS